MRFLIILIIFADFIFSSVRLNEVKINELKENNRNQILNIAREVIPTRAVIIEDFEGDTLILETHGDDDVDPNDWYLFHKYFQE